MRLACITLSAWLLLAAATSAGAQTLDWVNRYGGSGNDAGFAVAVDGSGNIFLAGYFSGTASFGGTSLVNNGGNPGLVVAKYNNAGVQQWSHGFSGTTGGITPTGIALDATGNIFVCGYYTGTANFGGTNCTSGGQQDCFLAKYSGLGAHLWSESFGSTGSDVFNGLAVDSTNNVVVTGTFQKTVSFGGTSFTSTLNTYQSIILAKYSSSGAHLWSETFTGNNNDYAYGIALNKSNDSILLGGGFYGTVNFGGGTLTTASGAFSDLYIAKLSSAGAYVWAKRYGGVNGDLATALAVDGSGNIIIGGTFNQQTDLGGGTINGTGFDVDMFLAKYSGVDGSYVWALDLAGDNGGSLNSVATDSQNNIVLTGYYYGLVNFGSIPLTSVSGSHDVFAAKYTPGSIGVPGSVVWARSFGGTGTDVGTAVAIDSADQAIITGFFGGVATFGGSTLTSAGASDMFLARLGVTRGPTYYVDHNAHGLNDGTSWANAWTNIPGIVNWDSGNAPVVPAGSTVWVSGDWQTSGFVYTNISMYGFAGTSNSPILLKASQEAGHNGIVKSTPFALNGQWFTVDGAADDSYANTIGNNTTTMWAISNNIHWWIRGPYPFGQNAASGINLPNAGPGMKLRWLHIEPYTFNTNNWPFGSNENGVGANTHGVVIVQNTGEHLDNGEIAYCYIEHVDQCDVSIQNNNSAHWGNQFRIHHSVLTLSGDAGARLAGGFEVDHNIIGLAWAIHGHPNGLAMVPSYSLLHHNVIYNTLDIPLYTAGGGSPVAFGIKVYDNLVYTTRDWSFDYTNAFTANAPFVNHGTAGAFQFLVEANANNTEPWLPQAWTNFVLAGNTVIGGLGSSSAHPSGGIQTTISTPNRYAPGNSLSFEPGTDRGFVTITNMWAENNLFYSVAYTGSGQTLGGFPNWVDRFSSDPTTWSNSALTYTAGILYRPTNLVFDYNNFAANDPAGKYFGYNLPYSTQSLVYAEQVNAAYSTNGYTHNTSVIPLLLDTNGYDFRPQLLDTTVVRKGTALWALTNSPGGMPGIEMDLLGNLRPATAWSIGAMEPDPSLLVWYTFSDLGAGGAGAKWSDATGNGHNGLFFGFPSTPTNWPTRVAYTNGTGYAARFEPDYGTWNAGHPGGQYGAVTNIWGLTNLYAITVCAWANYWPHTNGQDNVATLIDVTYGTNGVSWALGRDSAWQSSFSLYTNLNCNTSGALHINFPDDDSWSGPGLSLGTGWHFYAATFNTTNHTMKGYLDGTNCVSTDFTGYSPALTNLTVGYGQVGGVASGLCSAGGVFPGSHGWISVGCRTHSGSPDITDGDGFPNNGWFHGEMTGARIYNRALSASEIAVLFAGGGTAGGPAPVIDPFIATQPANQTIFVGQMAVFSVAATGNSPLHYQWRFDGTNVGSDSAVYTRVGVLNENGLQVQVIVTDQAGTATSTFATLRVNQGPVITSNPSSVTVAAGQNAAFNVSAIGSPTLGYRWTFNGGSVGGNSSSYTRTACVLADNGGQVICNVSNLFGVASSSLATLTVTNTTPAVIGSTVTSVRVTGAVQVKGNVTIH